MGNIIASQSNPHPEHSYFGAVGMCALALLLAWGTYALIKNGMENGFYRNDIYLSISAIIITIACIGGANVLLEHSQTQQNEYNIIKHATSNVPYYDIKKDGALIIANKKDNAPTWLADKVVTKIISENKTSYQVQFKDRYTRINKKDLK